MDQKTAAEPEKPHVLVIPYPAQGHINPALSFAKFLASKSLLITVITTTKISKTANFSHFNSISIATVSDGSEDVTKPETIEGYFKRFKAVFSHNLSKFIDEQTGSSAKLIVYDSTLPWILDIAHKRGLLGASFFTQSSAVNAFFYHVNEGSMIRFPYEDCTVLSLPCMPALEPKDLPSFSNFMDTNHTVVKFLAHQFSNIEDVDWIFFNTFDKLENEILEWMKSRWPIKTVGPTFLLGREDVKLSDKKNQTISLFEPKHDDAIACREWLDSREPGSVVYVSFGSIASLGNKQMEELAFGLITSNCYFLWVVRSSEVDKLPHDFTSEKGLIVEWCHQPEVLAHGALACFMTHCGWNSTLEALSNGVPLIAMAQWADQKTNSKFIEDVWKVGVGVKSGENGIVCREEIAMCIKEIVDGDKGIELKENACKLKQEANEAVQKGGTSANNIEDFVSTLKCR